MAFYLEPGDAIAVSAQNQQAPLECLPAELLVQIMLDLPDLDTLSYLIHASPRIFNVFRDSKATILTHFGRRYFHSSVLPEALSIIRFRELPFTRSTNELWTLLETPIEIRRQKLLSHMPLGRAVALCALGRSIEYFIREYAANTLPILDNLGEPIATHYVSKPLPIQAYSLSWDEGERLERALCRLELFNQIFHTCSRDGGFACHSCKQEVRWDRKPDQALYFLQQYLPDEIMEIQSIREYVERRLYGVLDEVEDYAVDHPIQAYYDLCVPTIDRPFGCPPQFHYSNAYRNRSAHIDYVTSMSLTFLRQLFQTTDQPAKQELLFHCNDWDCRCSISQDLLSEALKAYDAPHRSDLDDFKSDLGSWSRVLNEECQIPMSVGWIWYQEGDIQYYHKGLRDAGYAFWDFDRLMGANIIERE